MSRVRARVLIAGRVQGVFFRAETQRTARTLGLDGWVKNLPGGGVEAVFEGDRVSVGRAVEWCSHGPAHARVEDVRVTWEDPTGEEGFSVKY